MGNIKNYEKRKELLFLGKSSLYVIRFQLRYFSGYSVHEYTCDSQIFLWLPQQLLEIFSTDWVNQTPFLLL